MPDQLTSIFISYSRTDCPFVDRLEADLQTRGFQVWVDRSKLEGGQVWMDALQGAIDQCHVLLVILSPEAVESTFVRMEYRRALYKNKLVIPLEYRRCEDVPMDLSGIQWVNFKNTYDQGLKDLLIALSPDEQKGVRTSEPPSTKESVSVVPLSTPLSEEQIKNPLTQAISTPSPISRRAIVGLLGLAGAGTISFFSLFHRFPLFLPTSSHPLSQSSPFSKPTPDKKPLYTYRDHFGMVLAVAWSPDSKYVASGGDDCSLQVWHAMDGKQVWTYKAYTAPVTYVAWSPNQKYIASASDDHTVRIWNAMTGALISTYQGHSSAVHGIAWSPDSTRIASGSSDGTIQVYHAMTADHLWTRGDDGHFGNFWGVDWSRDGTYIAVGSSSGSVHVWDNNGRYLWIHSGHRDGARFVAWSPDSKHLASSSLDKTVRMWEPLTDANVKIFSGHSGNIYGVTWSPDNRYIALGGDGGILVWNAAYGNVDYSNISGGIIPIVWSPDGKYLASGSSDHMVKIWQAP